MTGEGRRFFFLYLERILSGRATVTVYFLPAPEGLKIADGLEVSTASASSLSCSKSYGGVSPVERLREDKN